MLFPQLLLLFFSIGLTGRVAAKSVESDHVNVTVFMNLFAMQLKLQVCRIHFYLVSACVVKTVLTVRW